jgi:hypothetical protein
MTKLKKIHLQARYEIAMLNLKGFLNRENSNEKIYYCNMRHNVGRRRDCP